MTDLQALPSDQDASGRSFGAGELERVARVLERGTLTGTKGPEVPELEVRFAALIGVEHAIACSSGTGAIHAAVGALDVEPGEEIVTTPITDMGAITPILAQGVIPVFADVDQSGNVTADSVAAVLSDRTRAIVTTHLFGNPADLTGLRALADRHGVALIEDCAQAYLAESQGRIVGSVGDLAAFSLQQGKHITTGEGGLVVARHPETARRARLFVNKGWPYGESDPDHEFLAPNLRFSELGAAVANAQLDRLESLVAHRIAMAERLGRAVASIDGIEGPVVQAGDRCSYWRYPLLVDPGVAGGPDALAARLGANGLAAAPRYIRKPAFACSVIADQKTFGSSRWPFTLARPEALDRSPERYEGTYRYLERVLVLGWNEGYGPAHVDRIADELQAALAGQAAA